MTPENNITEHLASIPDLANGLRYSKSNAQNQEMQNYLAPLAHQAFVRAETKDNPVVGAGLVAMSPIYNILKLIMKTGGPTSSTIARQLVESAGTGQALTSDPSVESIFRAIKGFQEGLGAK